MEIFFQERLAMQNPEVMERIEKAAPPKAQNPQEAMQARQFDPTKSGVLGAIIDN